MLTLIFDCDGTLHDSLRVYAPALRRVYAHMVAEGNAPLRNLSDEEIGSWLGWSTDDMWAAFAPSLPLESRRRYADEVSRHMVWGIEGGAARLYPHVEETLELLRDQGRNMVFLSNCRIAYMEAQREAFGFDRFFSGYYCCEQYPGEGKPQIFEHIRADVEAEHPGCGHGFVAIGDRFHDMELALAHGLRSIGCLYGFGEPGELDCATARVEDISEVPGVLEGWGI